MSERSEPWATSTRSALHAMAARWLIGLTLILALLLVGAAALQQALGLSDELSRWRLVSALLFGAACVLGAWLVRLRRPRAANAVVLLTILLAAALQAWATGIGLHSLLLSGAALAVAFAGLLSGATMAVALALTDAVVVVGLYGAERAGLLPGTVPSPTALFVGQLLLVVAGFAAALLVARLFAASVGRALAGEKRLEDLLHISSDWVWEMDSKGRLTFISPAFEARTGRRVAEFLLPPEQGGPQVVDDDEYRALRADMKARRAYREREITYRCADGTRLLVRGSGNPLFDDEGALVGWWGASRNVTAQRRAEGELQRSQAMVDRLVQLSPDAIVVASRRDGRILLANPAFLDLSGLSQEQVLGKSALELGFWRRAESAQQLGDALAAEGIVRNLRSEAWVGDERRDVLLTAAPFRADGEPVAVITVRDITEIERTKQQTDAVLDNASIGIAFVRQRRFERVNPQFEAMFGYPVGSLIGHPTATAFDDCDSLEAFALRSDRAQREGRPVDLERETRRPDGSVILARLRARLVDPAHVQEGGTIWVAEDVTERRRAERELAQAKQTAEDASQAKSSFLATMSHEIRTPLNGVLGLARLLQDSGLDERRRREYLVHLVDAAELLTGIVSDVLDLSKIEAGQLQIETVAFDLPAVVQSTFRTFSPLGRERGLAMDCRIAPDLPQRVRGDPVRVRQIIANYLNNALKFTHQGEIALAVTRVGPGRVRFEVRDTGIGVLPAAREQLFRPFAQADSSTTRRFGGTGLGLSICRELAERMGGSVGVDSDGRSGSRFWAEVELPADERPGAPDSRAAARRLGGLTVLVAEDNPVNMLIVGAMLKRLGATVVEAADGVQAVELALAQAGRLGAVLMDLHMPVLDGLAAARRLRADARTAALPVFALSAAVLEHERQDAQAAGMDGFVAKPVVEAELLRLLQPLVPVASGDAEALQ